MSTLKQVYANRRNAVKSTGPRTESGKAVASMNALKSGIHAQSLVIKGESAEALEALTAEYQAQYRPTTAEQRALVDILISNEWLLRRLRIAEAEIWNIGLSFIEDSKFQTKEYPVGAAFAIKEETFTRLQRRIDSAHRAFHRALQLLNRSAAVRESVYPYPHLNQPAPNSQPTAAEPTSPEIGFVPSPGAITPPEPSEILTSAPDSAFSSPPAVHRT